MSEPHGIDSTGESLELTVLAPVRNESRHIALSLDALAKQTLSPDRFEIILLDGDSTDDTLDIARTFESKIKKMSIVTNPGVSAAAGMNEGLRRARGRVIARMDGHAIAEPDYLETGLREILKLGDGDMLGAALRPTGDTAFGRAAAAVMRSRLAGGAAFRREGPETETADTAFLGFWRRPLIETLRGFRTDVGRNEDEELCARLRAAGGRVVLSRALKVSVFARRTPTALAIQYWRYGFWKPRVLISSPGAMRPRHFVPSIAVVLLTALVVAATKDVRFISLLEGLGAVYLTCGAFVAVSNHERRPGDIFNVWIAMSLMHACYGIGFLAGLFAMRRPRNAH